MIAKTYKIITDRLVIRCFQPSDARLVKQSIDESLEHLRPWMIWTKNEPETIEKKTERLRQFRGEFDLGIDYSFGIFNKEESVLIGSTGLHTRLNKNAREIGYWVNVNYLRQGIATEAVKALLKVGFEIESLDRIQISCDPNNLASKSIPKKLGFIHDDTLNNTKVDVHGNPRGDMIWTMHKEDYFKSELVNFELTAFDVTGKKIKNI